MTELIVSQWNSQGPHGGQGQPTLPSPHPHQAYPGHAQMGYPPRPPNKKNTGLWLLLGCGGLFVFGVIATVAGLAMLGSDRDAEGTWVLDRMETIEAVEEHETATSNEGGASGELASALYALMLTKIDKYEIRLDEDGTAHLRLDVPKTEALSAKDIEEEGQWTQSGEEIEIEFDAYAYRCDIKVDNLHCFEEKADGKKSASKLPIVFRKR